MKTFWLFAAVAIVPTVFAQKAEVLEVRKIWDAAPHNAFTDLIRFKEAWFCAFREGEKHVSSNGRLRIITSRDGRDWTSAGMVESKEGDLRDAKLSLTPDGRLMLLGAIALPQPAAYRHHSLAWFSRDGREWGEPHNVGDPDFWLWRVTWHKQTAYGFGYNTNPDRNKRTLRLYSSTNGINYQTLIKNAEVVNSPGESSIRFSGDTAYALVRRDPYRGDPPIAEQAATALIGTARPPYTNWTWKNTGIRIGGPNFIEVRKGEYIAGVRLHDGKVRTSLCRMDPIAGTLEEIIALPSNGDSSYPGLVMHQGALWVSYYSSHEGKSAIYLAKVKLR